MSRGRFGLLLGLAALVVGVAAFAAALAILDDGGADDPPGRATDGEASDTTAATDPDDDEGGEDGAVVTGDLPSPSFIVIVRSEASEDAAASVAADIADDGHDTGVLRSDDYPSLNPGFWVSYAGPYDGSDEATAAVATLAEDGWPNAYVRCAGTTADCS